jgi:O-acetyl-ADP-ribose deacetylase (regulator of RNase III)
MINYVTGNLIDLAEAGKFSVIVQGCNCFCQMGSGIAKEIRDRYPSAWLADNYTSTGDISKLGSWTHDVQHTFTIINAYTQYNIASSINEDVFEYSSFDVILRKLAHCYPGNRFGFPYIGTGLAGGDKTVIINSLEKFSASVNKSGGSVTLVEFK